MTYETLARIHARAMTVPAPWVAPTIEAFATAPGGFLVTIDDGFALGRVIVDEAELMTIAVDPDARRKGHGRALLAAFEKTAAEKGARRAFLEVAETNAAARGLYAQAGWQACGERPGYYRQDDGARIDALLLQKTL